jgi:polysaccharide chain length determinant protein (PEP-CTERM system associated)
MNTPNELQVQKYLKILSKFKWHGLIPACVIVVALGLASSLLPKVYESSCIVEIERGTIENPLKTRRWERPEDLRVQLAIFSENALRWGILSRVIDKAGADTIIQNSDIYGLEDLKQKVGLGKKEGLNIQGDHLQKEAVYSMLRKRIEISQRPPRFLVLSLRGRHSHVNTEILNSLVTAHIEDRTRAEMDAAGRNFEFVKTELENYGRQLELAETRLKDFKEQHIVELPSNISLNLTQLSNDKFELRASELEMMGLSKRLEYVEKELEQQNELIISEVTRESNPLQTVLNERIVDMEVELTRLRTNYTDMHPRIIELLGQLDDLKKRRDEVQESTIDSETSMLNPIYQQLAQNKQDILMDIEGLRNRISSLKNRVKENEEKVISVPKQEQELATLTRNYEVTAKIYNLLLEKVEEIRIQETLAAEEKDEESFRVVEYARSSLIPVGVGKLKLLMLIALMGLGTSVGIMLVLDHFDDSLNTIEEAKEFIQKPLLGTIPLLKKINRNDASSIRRNGMKAIGKL